MAAIVAQAGTSRPARFTGVLGAFPSPRAVDAETGFVLGGVNPTARLRALSSLNGIPLRDLEAICKPVAEMTPDDRAVVARYRLEAGTARSGFLRTGQSLRDVLADDNAYVVERRGLTHQAIAAALMELGERANRQRETVYQGVPFRLARRNFYGYQYSPFGDGTAANADIEITNTTTGATLRYGLLLPVLIDRYGFYEGDVSYRVDPATALEVLGFLH